MAKRNDANALKAGDNIRLYVKEGETEYQILNLTILRITGEEVMASVKNTMGSKEIRLCRMQTNNIDKDNNE